MSGGIAYVLDEDGKFGVRCNKTGVDLQRLKQSFDRIQLPMVIQKHVDYTGSPKAKRILDNWDTYVASFVKVLPREYWRSRG